MIRRIAETVLPTDLGEFRAHAFRDEDSGVEHVALVRGDLGTHADRGVLTRLHSECLTGDAFGSTRCDCGPQLRMAMALIAREGVGVVVYLRGHEGRGIGLVDKLRAYALQDAGADTIDANLQLGLPADARDYLAGVAMLRDLSVDAIRLMTNNPAKVAAMDGGDIEVRETVSLHTPVTPQNVLYLRAKESRFGHTLGLAAPEADRGVLG